jgi:hypothetical protein
MTASLAKNNEGNDFILFDTNGYLLGLTENIFKYIKQSD